MNRDEKGRLFFGSYEYGIQALIVLSLVASAFETLPELDPLWRQALRMFEIATILIFSVEYLMRIYFCSPRFSYAASYMGIIDLIAILPFFLMTGFDLRSVRVFRLFRLVRLLKMAIWQSHDSVLSSIFDCKGGVSAFWMCILDDPVFVFGRNLSL